MSHINIYSLNCVGVLGIHQRQFLALLTTAASIRWSCRSDKKDSPIFLNIGDGWLLLLYHLYAFECLLILPLHFIQLLFDFDLLMLQISEFLNIMIEHPLDCYLDSQVLRLHDLDVLILVDQLNELIRDLNPEILFELLLHFFVGEGHGRVDFEWELLLPRGECELVLLFEDVVSRHLLALLRWRCITFSIIRLLFFFRRLLLVGYLHRRFLFTIKELVATSFNLTYWIEQLDFITISQVIFI